MEIIIEAIKLLGFSSVFSGLIMLAINKSLKRRDDRQEELEKQNKAIMLGVQAILRDRLLQGYRHYIEKGWADYEDRENLENIYKQYHALGANGVMDDMRNQFRRLPSFQGGPPTIN